MTTLGEQSRAGLDAVFAPRSVAVVGASTDSTKRGHQILRALADAGYPGRVYPVNPRGGEILGHTVYPALGHLPEAPDLAVVCTPAASTPEVVQACGVRGIRGAVILAVGFGESGPEGRTLQARVLEAARDHGVRVVGPNTSGILNLPLGLNLIGARGVRRGSLSLLVQSGNMALGLMKEATERSWAGIALCAGLGNGADVGFAECLEYLEEDPHTRAILCHLEGAQDIRRFLAAASRVTRTTPVVVLKAGRSRAGAEAARSHTGSVAGPYDWLRAGLRQAGVAEVQRTDELLHVGETLAWQPVPSEEAGVLVLSDGGGQGTLAVDALTEHGVPLAEPSPETRTRLRGLLGSAAATGNPVDLAGAADADPGVFASATDILAEDPAVGGVLLVGLFGGYALRFDEGLLGAEEAAGSRMAELMAAAGKPLVVHTMFASERTAPLAALGTRHVPAVASLEVACRCVAALWERSRSLRSAPWEGGLPTAGVGGRASSLPAGARAEGRETLTETETRLLLSPEGVSFPRTELCQTADDAIRAWETMGESVALKVLSPLISHKSEAGGVALGCASARQVRAAFESVVAASHRYLAAAGHPTLISGVLVSPMLPPPVAELLVGASRDPHLGPVLSVGAGGIWVEVHQDVVHRVLPAGDADVRAALDELRIAPILRGHRGQPGADLDALTALVTGVGRCLQANPELGSVEVNPVFAYPDRAVGVDARAFLAPWVKATPSDGSTGASPRPRTP